MCFILKDDFLVLPIPYSKSIVWLSTKRGKHRTMSVEMEKMGEPIKARGISQESRPQQMMSPHDESLEEIKTSKV